MIQMTNDNYTIHFPQQNNSQIPLKTNVCIWYIHVPCYLEHLLVWSLIVIKPQLISINVHIFP